nr:ribonuclease H-like domain-containing protein [Tanacetum cinerariifolium]
MTWNISYLSDFEEINRGYVAFGGNPKGGKITSKDTECVVLSSDFKLPDENHVLLRVPRENNMYNVDLKNIVPSGYLTCLFAKATLDESNLWHKRIGYINFKTMNKFVNGIRREFSVARTPQQNGISERKNRTLIKAARTMLADSLLPILFWAEVVNTACYVQNRVLVTKPHNKTPYELLLCKTPSIGFMRHFGCPVTILNTLDPLGKFDGNANEGFLVGYSVSSKAFRVLNSRTRIVQETLHINFLENQPNVAGSGLTWLFDIDTLTQSMNHQPVVVGNQPNSSAGFEDPDYPNKVYKVVKAVYGLHQAPRAWSMWMTSFLDLPIKTLKQKPYGIFISQDKYVAEILRKFNLTEGKSASTSIDTKKPLLKDPDGEDVHIYRSMIGSLMYLTSSRPDIMFVVCASARFQVTPKATHLHAVKRIFRYLKGKPHLGLWYPKDSPFNLVTVVATSSTEAGYVAAASCCT